MIKTIIQNILNRFGYNIVKINKIKRSSLDAVLNNISNFFEPDCIVDVGAALGDWSRRSLKIFPNAKYILIEPLSNYNDSLNDIKSKIKNIDIIQGVASDSEGKTEFNMHEDLVGSSLKNEIEGESVDGKKISVNSSTLNNICKNDNLNTKYLIKIDTQGSELEVLDGADKILKNAECIILEVSLFQSFVNGPVLYDVIKKMKEFGFVTYDIFGALYRPYDNALSQVDIVFVKESGLFRKFQGYATKEQRETQNKKMLEKMNRMVNQ